MTIKIINADLTNKEHLRTIVAILNSYAKEEVGGGLPLSSEVRARLLTDLPSQSNAVILLAVNGNDTVGLALCFLGYSTFQANSLLNIHDLAVLPEHRGKGLGTMLLEAVIARARELACCKITLEVKASNAGARKLYELKGFSDYDSDGEASHTYFMEKRIKPVHQSS